MLSEETGSVEFQLHCASTQFMKAVGALVVVCALPELGSNLRRPVEPFRLSRSIQAAHSTIRDCIYLEPFLARIACTQRIDAGYCHLHMSLCLRVWLLVTAVSPAKTAEPTDRDAVSDVDAHDEK